LTFVMGLDLSPKNKTTGWPGLSMSFPTLTPAGS
jgi:hypothetical protein